MEPGGGEQLQQSVGRVLLLRGDDRHRPAARHDLDLQEVPPRCERRLVLVD